MANTWQDVLTPSIVTDVISRIRTPGNVLSRRLGFEIGGSNVQQVYGNTYTYDIFDNTRTVSLGKQPGGPASTIKAQIVGNNPNVLARFAEKINLSYYKVAMIRAIGEGASVMDKGGVSYIKHQGTFLSQRANNVREFMVGGLSRGGKYAFFLDGADLVPTYDTSGVYFNVDLRIDTGNVLTGTSFAAGLQMGTGANIIDAPWSTASTRIPSHLRKISAAFQDLVGEPLMEIWTDSTTWEYVIENDFVRTVAGTSNTSYKTHTMENMLNPDGSKSGLMLGTIHAVPWVNWVIYDGSVNVATTNATTFTNARVIQDGYAVFMINPGSWFKMIEGSEYIKDNDLAPAVEQVGFYSWIMEKADPARMELHTVQNAGLELNIPKAIAVARVR